MPDRELLTLPVSWCRTVPLLCILVCSCLASSQVQDDSSEPISLSSQAVNQPPASVPLEDFDPRGSVVIYLLGKQQWQPVVYRDCSQEQVQCFRDCWNVDPPWPREKGKQGHYSYCSEKCLKEYMLCMDAQATRFAFSSFAAARRWLYKHEELALGAVVVIGFGLFVIATDGGALVVAPKLMEYAPQLNFR